nr:recombinase family protein [Streptacidiphilus pinicola]
MYCRVAHRRSSRQVGVDQREAECRALAARAGIRVAPRRVLLDPQATSWSAGAARPGWEALLAELASGQVTHAVVYGVHELERVQPQDLAALLTLVEQHGLTLLDPAAPEDGAEFDHADRRRALLDRARLADRGRRRLADSVRAAQAEGAASGRPHGGGRRAFGYTLGDYDLVPEEADVVARVYAWFLTGRTLSWIARELTTERVPTAGGGRWTSTKVGRIIDAPRYAGLRVNGGELVRGPDGTPVRGAWKPCVPLADWEEARELRLRSRHQARAGRLTDRHYPLTGLVRCARCGHRMVGSTVDEYPTYACTGRRAADREPCFRYISATRLEELVDQQIPYLLDALGPHASPEAAPAALLDGRTAAARRHDQARLAELVAELDAGDPAADRERAEVTARIRAENRAVVLRAPDAVEGLLATGLPPAEWRQLPPEQQADVRRYLIGHIEVGPVTGPRSVFDPDRVVIVPHAA